MRHLRLVHSIPRRIDPTLDALLEYVRIIVPLPPVVRARALARARAAAAYQARPRKRDLK